MKCYSYYIAIILLAGFIFFSSFKNDLGAVQKQKREIQKAVEANLAAFSSKIERDCHERALEAARERVDAIKKERGISASAGKPVLPKVESGSKDIKAKTEGTNKGKKGRIKDDNR